MTAISRGLISGAVTWRRSAPAGARHVPQPKGNRTERRLAHPPDETARTIAARRTMSTKSPRLPRGTRRRATPAVTVGERPRSGRYRFAEGDDSAALKMLAARR